MCYGKPLAQKGINMTKAREFGIKRERVSRFLSERELDGVVLGRTDNFAWLGCGAQSVINAASETGVGTLIATADGVTLVTNNIEAERLVKEELKGLELRSVIAFPWHEPRRREELIREIVGSASFAADDGSCGLPPLPEEFKRLRYELTEAEVKRYRALGRDSSEALEEAARQVKKGMTESEIAGLLAVEHVQRGITPVVLLVAADARIRQWRHPLPKDKPLRRYAMLVACGRRHGLVTALTRFVHFGDLPPELAKRHRAVCEVDATLIVSTSPGRTAAEVFAAGQKAYKKAGFDGEWQLHHQGGAIGYQPREYIASPMCKERVLASQAFAWNPSICGTKSEDTVLVHEDGFELLTRPSKNWPAVEVEVEGQKVRRAGMLIR